MGGFYSSIFNITGWFLGALISFGIARRYGIPLVKKFFSLEKINKIESKIPKENLFFGVVVLRMMIPVDILSYALGLFSKMDFKKYSLATLIGITPFAIFLSYLGTVPFYYQVFGWIMILILVYLITRFYKKTFSDSLQKSL